MKTTGSSNYAAFVQVRVDGKEFLAVQKFKSEQEVVEWAKLNKHQVFELVEYRKKQAVIVLRDAP